MLCARMRAKACCTGTVGATDRAASPFAWSIDLTVVMRTSRVVTETLRSAARSRISTTADRGCGFITIRGRVRTLDAARLARLMSPAPALSTWTDLAFGLR